MLRKLIDLFRLIIETFPQLEIKATVSGLLSSTLDVFILPKFDFWETILVS